MTYFEKYKNIFKRFINESYDVIEASDIFINVFNENNLPDDLPHTVGGSFTDNDYIIERYNDFFTKNCIDIFADDLIHVIKNHYNNTTIDKNILKQKIKECLLFSYLNVKINYSSRESFIKIFYNSKIN